MDWQPLTPEELKEQTELYLNMAHGSLESLAHKCAVLAHRLTKYEGVPDKSQDNSE
jgi:hypothetical protein